MKKSDFISEAFDQMSKFEKEREDKLFAMGGVWRVLISTADYKERVLSSAINDCCKKKEVDRMIECIEWVAKLAYNCGLMDGKGYDTTLQEACDELIEERKVGRNGKKKTA